MMRLTTRNERPGWRMYNQYQSVMELADRLGFELGRDAYSDYDTDNLGVYYKEDRHPHYNHDMQMISGDLEQVQAFLHGIEWAKKHYEMLKLVSDKKVARKEQDFRNKQLVEVLAADA